MIYVQLMPLTKRRNPTNLTTVISHNLKYAALKAAEEMADAQLSEEDFDVETASAQLGIDVNALNLEDDEDDQIMSILGKRPVSSSLDSDTFPSSSSDIPPKKAVLELNENEQEIHEDIIVDAAGNLKKMEKKTETDVVDDLFKWKVRQ